MRRKVTRQTMTRQTVTRPLVAVAAASAAALAACSPSGPGVSDLPAGVTARLRDFRDVEVRPDGSLLPVALGGQPVSLCLRTPTHLDTSQWEARLALAGRRGDFAPPGERLERSLCFSGPVPAGLPPVLDTELCGELRDRFDGSTFRLPCQSLRYQADDSAYVELTAAWKAALATRAEGGLAGLLAELDAVANRSRDAGLEFLAIQIELIAVYFLRLEGTADTLAEAHARLAALPPWLERDEAVWWAAQAAYERALLDFESDPRSAWRHLSEADRLCLEVAHPIRFVVRMKQAEILSRAGVVQEAVDRLGAALDDCRDADCNAALLPAAHGHLAWLILLDPRSDEMDLRRAAKSLDAALGGLSADDAPLEVADHLISRGYLSSLEDEDPRPSLERARELIAATATGVARGRRLAHWADLVKGLAALRQGELDYALDLCNRVSLAADAPHLAAWARSCAGQVLHARGELDRASEAFEGALLLHEHTAPAHVGQAISPRPGLRSEDYYRAARVAVDRGRAARAWDILARLDGLGLAAGQPAAEGRAGDAPPLDREAAAERDELLRELIALDVPASGARRRQRAPMRRSLMERLQELARSVEGGERGGSPGGDAGLALRAVAVADEVLLLRRDRQGNVGVERRTPYPGARLRQAVADVARALDRRDLDDAAWRRLTSPLARALLPTDPAGEPVTTFALHGLLQGIPLAALPLPDAPAGPLPDAPAGPRWLGEVTTVALYPAGALALPALEALPETRPLFVVDPAGDLPSGGRLGAFYRQLFPAGRVLQGGEATRAAFQRELAQASWLHVDAHGAFDPAFPELSSLRLADHPVSLAELAGLRFPLAFANLSGCRTGSWPTTADSGRYGLAGHFARRGAAWVIASRTDLPDRLAADFNRAFYTAVAAGGSAAGVPEAYRQALDEVRREHPAAVWASILLLQGAPGGQTPALLTPTSVEGRSRADSRASGRLGSGPPFDRGGS